MCPDDFARNLPDDILENKSDIRPLLSEEVTLIRVEILPSSESGIVCSLFIKGVLIKTLLVCCIAKIANLDYIRLISINFRLMIPVLIN